MNSELYTRMFGNNQFSLIKFFEVISKQKSDIVNNSWVINPEGDSGFTKLALESARVIINKTYTADNLRFLLVVNKNNRTTLEDLESTLGQIRKKNRGGQIESQKIFKNRIKKKFFNKLFLMQLEKDIQRLSISYEINLNSKVYEIYFFELLFKNLGADSFVGQLLKQNKIMGGVEVAVLHDNHESFVLTFIFKLNGSSKALILAVIEAFVNYLIQIKGMGGPALREALHFSYKVQVFQFLFNQKQNSFEFQQNLIENHRYNSYYILADSYLNGDFESMFRKFNTILGSVDMRKQIFLFENIRIPKLGRTIQKSI